MGGDISLESTPGEGSTFSFTTVLSGYEVWKGNNSRTLEFYPHETLDNLSGAVPRREPGENQWDWSTRLRQEAVDYLMSEPVVAARLFTLRIYKAFFSIQSVNSSSWSGGWLGDIRPYLKIIGVVFMLVFRVLFFAALAHAIVTLMRAPNRSDRYTGAVSYIAFLVAFFAPYLIAFSYERQIIPVVFPTTLYLLFALENDHTLRRALARRLPFVPVHEHQRQHTGDRRLFLERVSQADRLHPVRGRGNNTP